MVDKDALRRRALALIAEDGHGAARRLVAEFGLSRQAANGHLQALLRNKQVEAEGSTRARVYRLVAIEEVVRDYPCEALREDVVWQEVFAPPWRACRTTRATSGATALPRW
jgi:predicted ArsR family transcriptional regulator